MDESTCIHYEHTPASGPRGEPPDTPPYDDCAKGHPAHECGEECPDYEPCGAYMPDWDLMAKERG